MYRLAIEELYEWKKSANRKPLIIEGARQVGKTWLMKEFGKQAYEKTVYINFDSNSRMAELFSSDLEIGRIIMGLELYSDVKITPENTLIIFDEVQEVPRALASLKYFYENAPEYNIICAGSLLGIALHQGTSFPVGKVDFLNLYPLSFKEFLMAMGKEKYVDLMNSGDYEMMTAFKQDLIDSLKHYYFVGGMPEAAQSWLDTHEIVNASSVHRRIVNTYIDDFAKYSLGADLALMQSVFRAIPAHVGEKVKYVNYSRDVKAAKVASIIDLFIKARIVCPVVHSDANGIPLGAEERMSSRKLLFLDVGLMNYANGLTWSQLSGMNDVSLVNEGKMAEQFVGQHLFFRQGDFEEPRLNYWLREGAKGNAEVDYIVEDGASVLPIEVKAGASGSLKALRQMLLDKNLERAIRFDASPFSRQTVSLGGSMTYELTTLPLYAIAKAFQ